jgi:hypothetical protein
MAKNSKEPSGLTKRISKLSLEEKTVMAIATVHTDHIAEARRDIRKCGMKWVFELKLSRKSLVSLRGTEASYAKLLAIKTPWILHVCRDSAPELV